MDLKESVYLKDHIKGLKEEGVWSLLREFFFHLEIDSAETNAVSEHGIDIVAFVNQDKDIIGGGYNILVQAKRGKLDLRRWRKEVLYQLLETPYYRIPHPNYIDTLSRRILLVVTDRVTPEARNSIEEFNCKHEVTIDLWELDDLLRQFDRTGFGRLKLQQIAGVGLPGEEKPVPPAVGEESSE